MNLLEKTTRNQQLAATPGVSSFVMANAGAGKTRVLTNRVARLLLAETTPEKILCITFTKAAAAEMAERLFDVLGEWALMDDETLSATLKKLEGDDYRPRKQEELGKARRLFARALETPGGLKIQTIHSFCESVLRRFPIEAGVPPGFSIIEDKAAATIIETGIDHICLAARNDEILHSAFTRLSLRYGENNFRSLLREGIANRLEFERALTANCSSDDNSETSIRGALEALAKKFDIDPDITDGTLRSTFIQNLVRSEFERAHDGLVASGGNPAKLGIYAATFLNTENLEDQWRALSSFFLTTTGTPRKSLTTKATDKVDPWVKDYLGQMQSAFVETTEHLKAHIIFEETTAFYEILHRLLLDYTHRKASSASLDFDDLIVGAQSLFKNIDAEWVMYKLDHGIDHILIDEAQDTSPDQWQVVEALFADYLSGAGARNDDRSFFAVGDLKQSIYSFQGANAGLFKQKEIDLGERLAAVTDYKNVPLALSFRTTEPVLSFVDALFVNPEAAEGLGGSDIPTHEIMRTGEAGLVELWPLTPKPDTPAINPWDAPVDAPEANHPSLQLSARVAQTIKEWLQQEKMLPSKGRPIRPGDILILVQSRGPLFDHIIESLGRSSIPLAGADRLKLIEDPAIEDLLSIIRFIITPTDDLSLAEALKSPLYQFDDDQDLFPLCYERRKGQSLWSALLERSAENPKWAFAKEELSQYRKASLSLGPFALLNQIMESGSPSGRERLYARLGLAAKDVLDEILRLTLEFENANPRNLRAFLYWFEDHAGEIKREMERTDDAVRIMTVHGAKGLEANIVFLLDAHRPARLRTTDAMKLVDETSLSDANANLIALTGGKTKDVEITAAARAIRDRQAYEEYRRLLYVAATRAQDQLFICGIEYGNSKNPHEKETAVKTWHALAVDAFVHLAETSPGRVVTETDAFWPDSSAPRLHFSCQQTAPTKTEQSETVATITNTPDWLSRPASREPVRPRIAPSKLVTEVSDLPEQVGASAYAPTGSNDPYFRGRVLHKLLELLPDLPEPSRKNAADRLLSQMAANTPLEERHNWRDEVLTVFSDPAFCDVFSEGSRACLLYTSPSPRDS